MGAGDHWLVVRLCLFCAVCFQTVLNTASGRRLMRRVNRSRTTSYSWGRHGTAGCGSAGACAKTTAVSVARPTCWPTSTGAARAGAPAGWPFQTRPCTPTIHVPRNWCHTSRLPIPASDVSCRLSSIREVIFAATVADLPRKVSPVPIPKSKPKPKPKAILRISSVLLNIVTWNMMRFKKYLLSYLFTRATENV